jgi:hypothetical protein
MWSFFLGAQFDMEFVFWVPSLMWSLFFGAQFDVEFFFGCPVCCGVCFLGAQFAVEFFLGAQFDVKFVFWVPSLMWSLFFIGPQFDVEFVFWRAAVWGFPLSGSTGILAQGIKSRTRILCTIGNPQPFTTDGGTLLACLPACLRA